MGAPRSWVGPYAYDRMLTGGRHREKAVSGKETTSVQYLRLLHTSDLHIDGRSERRTQGLEAIIDLAAHTGAHAILIAGDLFDHNRVDDGVVEFVIEQLNRYAGPVVIAAGNHDCRCEGSVYHRSGLWRHARQTHILPPDEGEAIELTGLGVTVWGRSLTTYGGGDDPFLGAPRVPPGDDRWHVGMGHGYVSDPAGRSWASFQIDPMGLRDSGMDYIALGDSHAFRCISDEPPLIYYSGAPSSGTHTAALIDFDPVTRKVAVCAQSLRAHFESWLRGGRMGLNDSGCV